MVPALSADFAGPYDGAPLAASGETLGFTGQANYHLCVLIGRGAECARVEQLLDDARAGRSGAVLLRGEAGIGKSALLRYARERALEMTVLEARGTESESEIPFVGLFDLLRPALGQIPSLPAAQRVALRAALALGPARPAERFAVYAGTLTLLAAAADDVPLLALVDDAQWLDASSAEALSFVARRLQAEGIALLFATREGEESIFDAPGVEVRELQGLDTDAGTALLAASFGEPPAPEVAERVVRETAGNPLALIELSRLLSPEQVAGREALDEPLPVGRSAEQAFLRRVAALTPASRRALLVVAAALPAGLHAILRASEALGLREGALEEAETAGLIAIEAGAVRFLHPLVRSSVYSAASQGERRMVHRALADAFVDQGLADRRAWHLAASALGPDEEIARALIEAAENARSRNGYAAAAAAFERSARLTPDAFPQTTRLIAAADAARLAGRLDDAVRLLDDALTCGSAAPNLRAAIQHARGRIELLRGRARTAFSLLTAQAPLLESADPDKAATTLAEAAVASLLAGDAPAALATAVHARETMANAGGLADLITTLMIGTALYRVGDAGKGFPLLMHGAAIAEERRPGVEAEHVTFAAQALIWAGEHKRARAMLESVIDQARTATALGLLPQALCVSATLDTRTGRWASAYASATEAAGIAEETGNALWRTFALGSLALLEAAQGNEERCRLHAKAAINLANALEIEYTREAGDALGLLELGLGRPDEAIKHLEPVLSVTIEEAANKPVLQRHSAPDLIEAYIRAGRDVPDHVVTLVSTEITNVQLATFRALAERCRGLLAGEREFDSHFTEALRAHEQTDLPFWKARTQLCYGERLRRAGRRLEARRQLAGALETFRHLGATPWERRAESELRATGERIRRRDPAAPERLTPQEFRIALLVAQGKTNSEVATALFLSLKTIEFHLGHVYRKLGLRSRSELTRLVVRQELPLQAAPETTTARR